MEQLKYAILGIVQGLTEFLPVSSSGHLAIAHRILGAAADLGFDTAVHVGTALAVVVFYFRDLVSYAADVFSPKARKGARDEKAGGLRFISLLLITTLPAAVAGYFFESKVEAAFSNPVAISLFLCVTGFTLIAISDRKQGFIHKPSDTGIIDALFIGLLQAVALFPGISRSGMTISAGLMCGFSAAWAVDYSMMASLPVILGAFVLQLSKGGLTSVGQSGANVAIGIAVSFATGLGAITILRKLAVRKAFKPFAAWAFIAAAVNLLLYLGLGI